MKWIYLIIAIITEVIATSALKESQGFSKIIPSIIVVVGYSFTFYFMSLTLKEMSVGITYAIWSGMGILLISLIGYFRYNQTLDAPAVLGMLFIGLGILIIRFFVIASCCAVQKFGTQEQKYYCLVVGNMNCSNSLCRFLHQ